MSWRTLKRKLKSYDAGRRALGANLRRRMAAVTVDLEQSTVDELYSKEEIKRWLTRLMHNSLEVHTLLMLTPVRDRTFRYENRMNDIRVVVAQIADKIEKMYEARERMDFRFKREFAESEEAGEAARGRERTPEADRRDAHLVELLGAFARLK